VSDGGREGGREGRRTRRRRSGYRTKNKKPTRQCGEKNYGKSQFLMGKLTKSMAMFNSFLYVYQRVSHHYSSENPRF